MKSFILPIKKHIESLKALGENFLKSEIVSYIFFGVLTTITGISVYWLALNAGIGIVFANTISHAVAITFAYITNKIWVFKSLGFSIKVVAKEYIVFLSGRIAAFILETLLLVALVYMLYFDPLLSRIFTSILVVIINYFISLKLVFKK